MGKLAVVFFAVLAFQAVLGRYTTGFGYDREEHSDLVRQLVTVSDDIYEIFHNTPLQRGFSWENREFGQELEEVIVYLEELTTKHDEHTSGIIFNVLNELREIRSYFKQLKNCTDRTIMRKLEIDLAITIKKVVKSIERFEEIFSESQISGAFHSDIKTILKKFVFALRNLYQNVNEHKMTSFGSEDVFSSKRHFYGEETTPEYYKNNKDIHEITKELEVTLERVHFEDVLMKRAFMHLVRRYFENLQEVLTPEFHQYYEMFFHTKDSMYSVQEVKTHIYSFIKMFVTRMEQMPETTYVAFVKATRKFESRLDILTEVNTPVRQLAIRIQTFADILTNWYETLPYQSGEFRGLFNEHAQQLVEILHRFISKIEKTETQHEFIVSLKNIVSHFEKTAGQHTFVVVIQEITTEVRKFLISHPEATEYKVVVGTEFMNVLEWVATEFDKLFDTKDAELWSTFLMAQTNKLSLYMHDDINSQDLSILMKHLNYMLEVLERESHPEYKKLAYALRQVMREFETERFMINSFLQKISLELNQFLWTFSEQNGRVPRDVVEVLSVYMKALETIHSNQRVVKGFLTAQTPVELVLKSQTVADRLTKKLHVMVPGFKQFKVASRLHYFNQVLEIVMFRLRKISVGYEKSDDLVMRVYENLRQIQHHLENVLEQTTLNTKVNFGVYIQNAFMELRKLAFEQHFEGHAEFVKLYSDFLFGLEYLVNQMQFDLQVIVEQYSVKTLNLQIETVAHTISSYLQRIQPKPELKRVVLIQVEALAQLVKPLAYSFRTMSGNNVFSELSLKYNKIYDELRQVTKMGWNKSIEDLTAFLDMHINTIVRDLGRLTSYKQETPEFYEVYKYVLNVFSNIMARLENVHYYEYYHVIVMNPQFSSFVHRLTSNVVSKLQNTFVESEEIKYDLALQTLKFAQRLENIALRFQVEAKVFPKGLLNIISEIQHIGATQSLSVNELKTKLSKYVMTVYTEIENIVDHESTVGLKEALIKYLVAVERLYFNIHNILVRSHNDGSFQTIFTRIDTYVHYLTKAIEHVDSENKVAFNVLRTEYRRLVNFVTVLSKRFNEFSGHHIKYQHIFNKLTEMKFVEAENYSNVDELEVRMIESLKHVSVVLKELAWALPEMQEYQGNSEVEITIKSFFDEFLTTIQRMHLEIETTVLIRQRMYNFTKWGLTSGRFALNYGIFAHGDNKYTSKYDEQYYGSFAKYFNKYGKQFNKYSKIFGGEYEPEYKFRGPLSHKYYGKFDRENIFEGQNWEYSPYTFKYGNNKYNTEWKYGQNWEQIPEEYKYGSKKYNSEWKYGQNWENTPKSHHKTMSQYETPKYFDEYKHQSPKTHKYGGYSSMHQYETPEYFGDYKHQSPKTHKYGGYSSMHQYESPEYFGKYTYGNEYATKSLQSLFQHIRTIAQEVTEELKEVPLTKGLIKRDLTVYVRELIQIVDHIIYRFEQENTTVYKISHIIENFQQIKVELEQLIRSTVSFQPSQVKYQFSSAIEQIVNQFEKLAQLEQYNEVQFFKDVFVQFLNYIRNVKYQINSNVYGRELEGYNTKVNYYHEKPFYAFDFLRVIPKINQEFTKEY